MSDEIERGDDRRVSDRRMGWLVSDWKAAYKWFSVQAAAALAALQVIYELLPAAQAYVPPTVWKWLMIAGLIAVILGRLKNQPAKTEPAK